MPYQFVTYYKNSFLEKENILTDNIIPCIVRRFCLTKGGMGLHTAFKPCISRGNVSARDNSIWFGRRYLKKKSSMFNLFYNDIQHKRR